MPILQQPVWPLDVSVQQQSLLSHGRISSKADFAAWMCQFYSRLCCPVLHQPNSLCTSLFSAVQQNVLPLDAHVNREPMLPLDGSVLKQPVLPGQIFSTEAYAASVLKQPVLPLNGSVYSSLRFLCTCLFFCSSGDCSL